MTPDPVAELIIPSSKGKILLLLLGAVAFVAGSIWLWSIADLQTRHDPLYVKAVAIAGIALFGLSAIYGCIKFFDRRPGLIVDSLGIVDNSSAVAAGRILWDEVIALRIAEVSGQRFIVVMVEDSRKFMERGGFLKRMLGAANIKMTGSPINISANSLRSRFDELVHALNRAFEEHKVRGRPDA